MGPDCALTKDRNNRPSPQWRCFFAFIKTPLLSLTGFAVSPFPVCRDPCFELPPSCFRAQSSRAQFPFSFFPLPDNALRPFCSHYQLFPSFQIRCCPDPIHHGDRIKPEFPLLLRPGLPFKVFLPRGLLPNVLAFTCCPPPPVSGKNRLLICFSFLFTFCGFFSPTRRGRKCFFFSSPL